MRQVSNLTKEQKEKIASGPAFNEFLSDARAETDYTSYTGALKSKSGERYFYVIIISFLLLFCLWYC